MNRLNIQLGNPICAFVAFIYVCATPAALIALLCLRVPIAWANVWVGWVMALMVCMTMRSCEKVADSTH